MAYEVGTCKTTLCKRWYKGADVYTIDNHHHRFSGCYTSFGTTQLHYIWATTFSNYFLVSSSTLFHSYAHTHIIQTTICRTFNTILKRQNWMSTTPKMIFNVSLVDKGEVVDEEEEERMSEKHESYLGRNCNVHHHQYQKL